MPTGFWDRQDRRDHKRTESALIVWAQFLVGEAVDESAGAGVVTASHVEHDHEMVNEQAF